MENTFPVFLFLMAGKLLSKEMQCNLLLIEGEWPQHHTQIQCITICNAKTRQILGLSLIYVSNEHSEMVIK